MRRLFLATVFLFALHGCQKEKQHNHLVCHDADGVKRVDALIRGTPRQYTGAWGWREEDGSYHEVSVPPHSCRFEKRNSKDPCTLQKDPSATAEAPE